MMYIQQRYFPKHMQCSKEDCLAQIVISCKKKRQPLAWYVNRILINDYLDAQLTQ